MDTVPEFIFNYDVSAWIKSPESTKLNEFNTKTPMKIRCVLSNDQFNSVQKTLETYGQTMVGKSKALRMISSTNLWRRPIQNESSVGPRGSADNVWYDND